MLLITQVIPQARRHPHPASPTAGGFLACAIIATGFCVGCETDSYMNPSVTGYFENTPTTMPVLDRLDVIEPPEEPLGVNGPPEPQDLQPNTLQYRLASGDEIAVEIYELISQGKTEAALRTVDQAGYIRLPTINEVKASGLTLEELRESIRTKLEPFVKNPVVTVDIQKGRSFEFSIQGAIQNSGIFALTKSNFRLTQAIAMAGGADVVTERVLIVRSMDVERESAETPQDNQIPDTAQPQPSTQQASPSKGTGTTAQPVDIEALINQLSETGPTSPTQPPTPSPAPAPNSPPTPAPELAPTPAATPAPTPAPAPPPTPDSPPPSSPSPGAVRGQQAPPPIDIDSLEPVSVLDAPSINTQTATQRTPQSQLSNEGDSFIFDVNSQQWVRIRGGRAAAVQPVVVTDPVSPVPSGSAITGEAARQLTTPDAFTALPLPAAERSEAKNAKLKDPRLVFNTRIIEVDYDRLMRGDQSQNVVIRPGDDIYLQFPPIGMVYIDGEINRPGVFQLPSYGRLTLSRLVASAGGLTEIAIPERVDLVRRLPGGREAAIRVNLAAIRNMAEPDVILKKDDHVIIGTNFWATPLAVFRNGLRITYGFGFLLDRNWGNDVFGPPPQQETINF